MDKTVQDIQRGDSHWWPTSPPGNLSGCNRVVNDVATCYSIDLSPDPQLVSSTPQFVDTLPIPIWKCFLLILCLCLWLCFFLLILCLCLLQDAGPLRICCYCWLQIRLCCWLLLRLCCWLLLLLCCWLLLI